MKTSISIRLMIISIAACILFSFTGCGEPDTQGQGPMERAGKAADEAAEKAGEKIQEGARKTGEALEHAGEKLQDATKPDEPAAPVSSPAPAP